MSNISADGVRYYHNLINELLANNIQPFLTLYHWDHPQTIEDLGGWLSPDIVDWFGDYARVIYKEFGSKVKKFIPINEPGSICKNGYSLGSHAPAKKSHGFAEYMCMHNLIKAHARAYRIYEKEFKQQYKGEVGFNVHHFASMPRSLEDENAAELAFQFDVGWTMNPIYTKGGDYPDIMKTTIAKKSIEQGYNRTRLPTFDAQWIKYIRYSIALLPFRSRS